MQVAILIGGKCTRVKSISKKIPKPFLKINKRAIIDHQIKKLNNFNKIYILSNEGLAKFHNTLKKRYKKKKIIIFEEKKPLGNGGCLKELENYISEDILILSGDLIFNIDFKKFFLFHKRNKSDISFLVHPNDHPFDSDLLEINKENKLIKFHKKPHSKKNIGNLCLSGIMIINKKILKFIKPNKFQDFSKNILPKLIKKKIKIYAYNTREYVKDVGTPKRIKLVGKHIKTKKYINGIISKKLPAIFLDRDGVINKEHPQKHYQNPMEINKGAVSAVKTINERGYLAVIITNQSAIAKGVLTIDELENDHKKLEYYFGKFGAYFDRIYYCPHYPINGFKGEIKKLKKKCSWRKPNNGMLIQAIKDLNIDVKNSYMIGDRLTDYNAAKKTKVKFMIVGNKFKINGIKNYKSLYKAVKSIF